MMRFPTRRGPSTLAVLVSFALVTASAGQTFAQQSQPRETTPSHQDSGSDGTAPHGMGSTGWTGGTGGSHIGKGATSGATSGAGSASAQQGAADQPEMATGVDLNGPPTRFRAIDTPE